ncbi:YeiH family protein [Halomarina halobia]|uniref:YeiH family protein n=1 Tax=Halomarina halobia TaxID=3033386 RepID=A0ABD6AEK1_9EURY|nr:putative sulfate exporter family transporter [Halomarina sp. PSR21]
MGSARLPNRLPGLVLLGLVALGANLAAAHIPGVSDLILAVAVGALISNLVGTPAWAQAGVDTHKLLLEIGIVLLGARLTLGQVLETGPLVAGLVVVVVAFGVLFIEVLSRTLFDLGERTGSLLAAGSSICGVSAVVAVAGGIDADENEIAYAAATVLLFDAVTLVAFPIAGEGLVLSGRTFGIWVGLSMFSTGPVAAAGFAHSGIAGQWATLTKLVRNSLIGAVVLAYSVYYARSRAERAGIGELWTRFPKFVFGFLAVAALVNLGGATATQVASIDAAADWLFALAFAGLGLEIRLAEMRQVGFAPVLLVLVSLVTVSTLSLVAIALLF